MWKEYIKDFEYAISLAQRGDQRHTDLLARLVQLTRLQELKDDPNCDTEEYLNTMVAQMGIPIAG